MLSADDTITLAGNEVNNKLEILYWWELFHLLIYMYYKHSIWRDSLCINIKLKIANIYLDVDNSIYM